MAQMIRKQIYIQRRQQALLKRLARARGVSEAEQIRQAIDNHVAAGARLAPPDPEAWDQARRFMLSLHARGPVQGQPRNWKREDLYEERLSRHARRSDKRDESRRRVMNVSGHLKGFAKILSSLAILSQGCACISQMV